MTICCVHLTPLLLPPTFRRAGDMASTTLAPFAVLLALIAGLWLGFQLGKVDDMCSVGRESLHIGGFMVWSAREKPFEHARESKVENMNTLRNSFCTEIPPVGLHGE